MDAIAAGVSFFGVLALVLGPAIVLRVRGARWRWFALGVASWTVALLVKIVVNVAYAAARPGSSAWEQGAWYGSVSAVCELGMTALLLRPPLPTADVLAFGAGVGSFEIVYKVALGVAAAQSTGDGGAPAAVPAAMALVGLAQHAACLVSHTATRVLVYLTRSRRLAAPALIAFATFVLVDGTAAYGSAAGWHWESIEVFGPFVALLVVLACIETAAARAFWIEVGRA